MKFENSQWLLGAVLALVVGGLLLLGAHRGQRALRRFGELSLMTSLVTSSAAGRRALKGGLLVLSLAACFIALAQPQYGWGTRRIPATNLDVILVLDYSKSMYARDVAPSRTERAKSEVARLIRQLPGARFGAVAFAGEPLSFPLTSDGGAIAQFFRQLSPHDMPVGGTAIARALAAGRALLARDPRAAKHRKVMLLVTDGEDLEGDPVEGAREAKAMGVSIHVVQIGGRAPEIIPNIDENGANRGVRRDRQGKVMTTSLTVEGEKQLTEIAEVSGGSIIRTEAGTTGIDEVARRLRVMMTQELSERVETVFADVYAYPLGFALLLLLLEAGIAEATMGRRWPFGRRRKAKNTDSNVQSKPAAKALALLVALLCTGCDSAWVDSLFMRNAPAVDDAVYQLEHGDAGLAQAYLASYFGVAPCVDGRSGAPAVFDKPQASFDLGLALFALGEQFGGRFGEDGGPAQDAPAQLAKRSSQVSCAMGWLQPLVQMRSLPVKLRAEASYLLGNLEFLRREYEAAVEGYDVALALIPGSQEPAALAVGVNAAHNRALALRRAEEQPEPPEPPDAGTPPPSDGGSPSDDSENSDGDDKKPSDKQDPNSDKKDSKQEPPEDKKPEDKEEDKSKQEEPDQNQSEPEDQQEQKAPPPKPEPGPSLSQDDRVLDKLERAPTVQQAAARARKSRIRRGAQDK